MKELTIEQKAKAYDEALERARAFNNGEDVDIEAGTTFCEYIFPELKESEDEKIRKWLITQLKLKSDVNNSRDLDLMILKSITWLEKQGKKKSKKVSIWKHWKNGITGNGEGKQVFLTKIGHTYKLSSCLSGECDYIELSELDNLLLEKQSKQKPTDKVESKFCVRDWVVTDKGDTIQIAAVNFGYYTLNNGMDFSTSYVDKYWHLWDIQDAKDGDVLAAHDCLVLFKKLDGLNIKCYCTYHFMNYQSFHVDTLQNKDAFHPATKEQRDLLFQKMKEAGYEWDAEKKELKKIEDEPENYKQQLMSEITDLVEDYIRQKPVKWDGEDEKILQ